MPKIVDPDGLIEGCLTCCAGANIDVNTQNKTITLEKSNGLTDCGVTLQAVYSKLKKLWKDCTDTSPCMTTPFIAFDFPMISITDEQFELVCNWNFSTTDNCTTKLLIRDGGWARVDVNGVRQEEYMSLVTLGNFDSSNGATFTASAAPCCIDFTTTTITRADPCGSWLVDGFTDYNPITITGSATCANNITFTPTDVTATVITAAASTFTAACNCIAATLTQSGTGIAYYQQTGNGPTACINLAGPVNQAVKIAEVTQERTPASGLSFTHSCVCADTITGNASDFAGWTAPGFITITGAACSSNNGTFLVCMISGACCITLTLNNAEAIVTAACDSTARIIQETDNRKYFKIWLREEQKTYDYYDLITCQNLTNGLVNKKFALPLSDGIDNKISDKDYIIAADPCTNYDGITIKLYNKDQAQCISGSSFNYRTVINANCNPNVNVYQYVQRELRRSASPAWGCCGDICDRVCADPCPVPSCAAEITAVTLPAKACISESDYWVMNSANNARKYHVWYTLTCMVACQIEPVVNLSTGIKVDVSGDTTACQVATRTHAAITSTVCGLTKNTHLLDFTAVVCTAVVTVTNRDTGRTTNFNEGTVASPCTFTFSVGTCNEGDTAIVIGETANELLTFVGCCLVTSTGVFIDNVFVPCTNNTTHTDVCGVGRQFAFVSTGTLTFNSNLVNDLGPAKYFMYYTTTPGQAAESATVNFSAPCNTIVITSGCMNWTVPPYEFVADDVITISNAVDGGNNIAYRITSISGACMCTINVACVSACETADVICVAVCMLAFGTDEATLVDDNSATNITGTICMACITFDYDYDNNTQGGRTAAPCNDPSITVVAIGLCSAQYVVATSSISRSKTNNISVVAALERNFSDPA